MSVKAQMSEVLRLEAEALHQMAQELGTDHEAAIALLADVTGRIIVTGVGKSGHIGHKIAATFASTGAPAHFVHPTEASHGDMGMITKQDLCLAISNSGETSELVDIVTYTRRFSIPLIAITRDPKSTLARQADIVLRLPNAREACAIGVAPTTSTTATLALGDALAVALMHRRGFKREDFHVLHPGGKLGAQLKHASDLMHTGDAVPLVDEDAPMSDALLEMTSKGFGLTGVIADGVLSGVVTDGDLRRNMADLMIQTAGTVATRSPKMIQPEALASEALAAMNETKISALFVVNPDGKPLGVLHIHDCLRAGVA
ncbi:MAG: KpsF/GutQ family sugar-phosphate isomerase [Marinovum sp.]|nr:KpsF/GutQ family sugar-phosphate isomerase [Marinovum sp.]